MQKAFLLTLRNHGEVRVHVSTDGSDLIKIQRAGADQSVLDHVFVHNSEVDRSHHISGSHAELLSPHGVSSSVLLHGGSSHRVARLDFDVRILLTKKLRLTEVRRLHNGDDKGDHGKR